MIYTARTSALINKDWNLSLSVHMRLHDCQTTVLLSCPSVSHFFYLSVSEKYLFIQLFNTITLIQLILMDTVKRKAWFNFISLQHQLCWTPPNHKETSTRSQVGNQTHFWTDVYPLHMRPPQPPRSWIHFCTVVSKPSPQTHHSDTAALSADANSCELTLEQEPGQATNRGSQPHFPTCASQAQSGWVTRWDRRSQFPITQHQCHVDQGCNSDPSFGIKCLNALLSVEPSS